jgi:phosphotransferase system  glucose/maltose/N-acetylglucosamine-specific IIC component
VETKGASSFRDSKFREEKREFWAWPFLLALVIFLLLQFYHTYYSQLQTKQTGQFIEVRVIDKIRKFNRGPKYKIGIMHGHVPIYVGAGSRWFHSTAIGSTTKVIYNDKYHTYLDPYRRFENDIFFMAFFILISLIITWRAIWLGLYIWHWK